MAISDSAHLHKTSEILETQVGLLLFVGGGTTTQLNSRGCIAHLIAMIGRVASGRASFCCFKSNSSISESEIGCRRNGAQAICWPL